MFLKERTVCFVEDRSPETRVEVGRSDWRPQMIVSWTKEVGSGQNQE